MPAIPIPAVAEPEWMPGWSKWFPLNDLAKIDKKYLDSWGIYAIALKDGDLGSTPADPLDESIQIIGETRGRNTTLGTRCYMARQVLKGGEAPHGPARTLRSQIGPRVHLNELAIALYPVWEADETRSQCLTMTLERIFIFNYVCKYGRRPYANSE